MRLFSSQHRPVHLGPYPLERLARIDAPDLASAPAMQPLRFARPETPESLVNAMGEYQAMLDALRPGLINQSVAEIPADLQERSEHLKAFAYFNDAALVGICAIPDSARLEQPLVNPEVERLAEALRTRQTQTLASGIDMIMADLKDSMETPPGGIGAHSFALVIANDNPRAPEADEPGCDWIQDALAHRACLRTSENAVVLANYLRLLGYDAKAHSGAASDVDLNQLALAAGIAWVENGALRAPYLAHSFGLAAVTCTLELATDQALAPPTGYGLRWQIGHGSQRSALHGDPFDTRRFVDGPLPFESIPRVEQPTTYIDEANVARVPKRTDMFARAQFGDMGPRLQNAAKGGYYARKAAPSYAQRRALGAFVLIQNGDPATGVTRPDDTQYNAQQIKAACYFLGVDAVGLSRCPDWAWYSHDALGEEIVPTQHNAISMIIDQGFETMEGASGDDWISVAQSMRAYLRFSLLGGVIAQQIRNLGYSAKAHTVMDGEVLQPPLLLLSGLGEVSRIGEVILHPLLGPRLKSGVVTTDMPLSHDQPIDFGLQHFCNNCQKCARECPSGAITAGPKRMFNGYEIWKSDSQKCATYRITTPGGAMCGRCMKTCPWNLEGLFAEKPFRWLASNVPAAAKSLAALDDKLGRGRINPIKKWWWDLELQYDGAYRPTPIPTNQRELQPRLRLRPEDQTLAVYPAPLAPPPWPYPFPMDREAGIRAHNALLSAEQYRQQQAEGIDVVHRYQLPEDAPVVRAQVVKVEATTERVRQYDFAALDGAALPEWSAGAHIDVLVAPEYLRQYSLCGDPSERHRYRIGVLREDAGRGGSQLMQRIFQEGRQVFLSRPVNHFALNESAPHTLLLGGGIGVTPMLAFAHRLHAIQANFTLHYSAPSRAEAPFLAELAAAPWSARVQYHFSDQARADFAVILRDYAPGWQVYLCGPPRYIDAITQAARAVGMPDEDIHAEYFAAPVSEEREKHPFRIRLRDGRELAVSSDQNASDALINAGIAVEVKCSDGICGVCQCGLIAGEVEHRDFVLSNAQRRTRMITCQSRAAEPNGLIELDIG